VSDPAGEPTPAPDDSAPGTVTLSGFDKPAPGLDESAMAAARERWATRAKPPGSLGALEDLGVHLAGLAGTCPPPVPLRPAVVVFAGDHGVVADGASAWPSEVTVAMVASMAAGGAAINAFARTVGASVAVVDVGVAGPISADLGVLDRRVRSGTGSIVAGPAMTLAEAEAAVAVGIELADAQLAAGADCLVGGEMGIGNTTPSTALIAVVAGVAPEVVVGPGAGVPGKGIDHKRVLVATAIERAGPPAGGLELLAELGGLEIGALCGFQIGAARARVPFVVDGVIALAALCIADLLAPGTARLAIAGHRSSEPAATVALAHLQLEPLLDLGLRLGEGTGACLAVPLVTAAARALADMADIPA
jgi:nicotinate-nucleotide--dimethylbenzimidazole phosphoribosyltransferase